MEAGLVHRCSSCGHRFALEQLPSAGERIFASAEKNISLDRYVFAYCPNCGHRDWAKERRYLGVVGPRGLYALRVGILSAFLVGVYFIGFVWNK